MYDTTTTSASVDLSHKVESVKELLKGRFTNDSNDIRTNTNNDTNDSTHNPYALDETKFVPNTEGSLLAKEIATELNDLENFAFYMGVVKRKGVDRVRDVYQKVLGDIREKKDTKYPVRNPAKYFTAKILGRF